MRRGLQRMLATLGLLAAAACGREPAPAPIAWSVARGDPWETPLGRARSETAWRVSRWFGRAAAPGEEPPVILDEGRIGLVLSTPGQIRLELPEGGPWRFRALLRAAGGEGVAVRLLAETPGLELLAEARASAGEAQPWEVSVPAGVRALDLTARRPGAGHDAETGPELLLGEPRVVAAPAGGGTARAPDVLLLTVDTLRADALDDAPRLQRLFASGWLWTDAVSPSSWTLPSYASLFTALDAPEHGAGRGRIPPPGGPGGPRDYRAIRAGLPLLAQELRRAGWATAMVHQNPFLEPWTGLQRGFDLWLRTRDDAASTLAEARRWWGQHEGEPRFLVLHVLGPHLPYDPPGPDGDLPPDPLADRPWRRFLAEDHSPEERRAFFDLPPAERDALRRRYAAEVASVDEVLAPWLESLAASARPPLLILHSDHGEEHWEAGSFEHGHAFPDSVVRVPLAILAPPWTEAPRPPGMARVRDLAPTLLRWLDLPRPPGWKGDLGSPPDRILCSGILYPGPVGGVVIRRAAPGESLPIPAADSGGAQGPPATLEAGLAEALAALGYGPSGD